MRDAVQHVHLDTRTITEPDRFEVWRSYYRRTLLDLPDASRAAHYTAKGDIIARPDGVMFTAGQCEATRTYLSGDISDFILFGSVLDGETRYTHADNDPVSVRPRSGLTMLSPRDQVLISNEYHRYALIIVPKRLARARLGIDIPDHGRSVFTFPRSPMAQMLDGLLRLTTQKAHAFSDAASRTSLNSLVEFALATLMEENDLQEERLPDADRAYFGAICSVIRSNVHNRHLDPAFIADRLGISRTSLYRILAGRDETAGRLIRHIRLERAQQLLSDAPHYDLSEVAGRSGYSSPAAFARAFRAATGMTATDWRRMNTRTIPAKR